MARLSLLFVCALFKPIPIRLFLAPFPYVLDPYPTLPPLPTVISLIAFCDISRFHCVLSSLHDTAPYSLSTFNSFSPCLGL